MNNPFKIIPVRFGGSDVGWVGECNVCMHMLHGFADAGIFKLNI